MKTYIFSFFTLVSSFLTSQSQIKEIEKLEIYAISYETIFEFHPTLKELINERGQYVRVIDKHSIKTSLITYYLTELQVFN